MIRQLTAIFFLLIFSVPQFNKILVVMDYYANKASYAKNCVNKYRPMLHCNGKCQLMKKLKEQEKKEQQQDLRSDIKNEVLSSRSYASILLRPFSIEIPKLYTDPVPGLLAGADADIFHPPGMRA